MSCLLKIKKCMVNGAIALLLLTMVNAYAETRQEGKLKQVIVERLGKGAKVDAVTKTPYSGLYEVRTGGKIIYTDAKAEYIFAGHIFDAKTGKNFTKIRLKEINKVKFADLPFDLAIKTVKGNGKRKLAVFSDPNCGYCKRFEMTLEDVDNITVYTFMYNILRKDSATKARNIWCSASPRKTWQKWMLDGKLPPTASAKCDYSGQKVFNLGRRLNITGTPTIFFTDGTRVPGAIDARMLEEKLAKTK